MVGFRLHLEKLAAAFGFLRLLAGRSVHGFGVEWDRCLDDGPPARRRGHLEAPSEHVGPLSHSEQSEVRGGEIIDVPG